MEYTITPLTPHTGAEVRGIDLNEGGAPEKEGRGRHEHLFRHATVVAEKPTNKAEPSMAEPVDLAIDAPVALAGEVAKSSGTGSSPTQRWRETDSNFQYASTVTLVSAPTSSSIIGSPSMFPF